MEARAQLQCKSNIAPFVVVHAPTEDQPACVKNPAWKELDNLIGQVPSGDGLLVPAKTTPGRQTGGQIYRQMSAYGGYKISQNGERMLCCTYSHHCQIADMKPSKGSKERSPISGGFRICVGLPPRAITPVYISWLPRHSS